jgi:DNA repair photolyase
MKTETTLKREMAETPGLAQSRAGLTKPKRSKVATCLKTSGTREWAVKTVNCCTGCAHSCRYCFSRSMAVRFRQVSPEGWKNERIRWKDVEKAYGHIEGTVMVPSSHDITPTNFQACFTVLKKLLEAGNRVLVVSKPHLECIARICEDLSQYRGQLLFRFTIGACDNEILSFWEPNAPRYEERKAALKYAFEKGYATSVSTEPMLDSDHIEDLVSDLLPFVTDAIWIGTMNHLRSIEIDDEAVARAIDKIQAGQTEERIKAIYERLKGNQKIKWKAEIKKILGLPQAEKPGMDK